VGGAEDVALLEIEENIGPPIERRARVRAGVLVSDDAPGVADHKDRAHPGASAEAEAAAARLGDLVEAAEF
jgi:hypothetical protein